MADLDRNAQVLAFQAMVVRCQCGGITWRPNAAGDGEFCVWCGRPSPLSVPGASTLCIAPEGSP